MKRIDLKMIERICIAAMAVLVVVIGASFYRLHKIHQRAEEIANPVGMEAARSEESMTISETEPAAEEKLAEISDFLPENLRYGTRLPVSTFETADGRTVDIRKAYAGETLVLMYWGSWCSDCDRQLGHMEEFEQALETMDAVKLLLVNRTEPEKGETVEKAASWLQEKGIENDCVFDIGRTAYDAYGGRQIPTTIVIDGDGYVRAMAADVIESGEELQHLLTYSMYGGAPQLMDFINQNMINAEGGIYTNYLDSAGTSPTGHDILSESMGLMMEYAVLTGDKALFDRTYGFLKANMERDGLFAWYFTKDGQCAGSNSFLDDLRIAGALLDAQHLWGGYDEDLKLAGTLAEKNVYKKQLSSFYDFNQAAAGDSISLSYGDFKTMNALAEVTDGFAENKEKFLEVVEQGYISDQFPLYYSSWNYEKKEYAKNSLNTAEALLTLYHLAEVGKIRQTSLDWLRERLMQDNLGARYEIDGSVPVGYAFDSTAVYAIAALIGKECGDPWIYRLAIEKMERARVTDVVSPFYGCFSTKRNGEDVTAFDQLLPLLVYADFGKVTFQ